jgi:hypothetical protein
MTKNWKELTPAEKREARFARGCCEGLEIKSKKPARPIRPA